jgi:hypothetical protein
MPARSTLECACLEQYATRRPHTVPSGPFPEKQDHRGDDSQSKDDIKILRLEMTWVLSGPVTAHLSPPPPAA